MRVQLQTHGVLIIRGDYTVNVLRMGRPGLDTKVPGGSSAGVKVGWGFCSYNQVSRLLSVCIQSTVQISVDVCLKMYSIHTPIV